MAEIILRGPKCIDAALKFKKGMGCACWDLSPDIVEAVRMDVVSELTPKDAIEFVDRIASNPKIEWIDHDGWTATYNGPPYNGVAGVPI